MRGVLDGDPVSGVLPAAAISIYANNARANFVRTLTLAYPAIWRLVGEDYFRQCAHEFQKLSPSSSGDLQHVGEGFGGYLASLHGTDKYSYLAEVARLEWAYQEALIEREDSPLELSRLGSVEPQHYRDMRFELQPSTRLVESAFPILAIWQANVDEQPGQDRIDLGSGADRLLLVRVFRCVRIHRLTPGEFVFLSRLLARDTFGAALEAASAADALFDPGASLQRIFALRVIIDFHI
jgi:hypothetical protein